MAVRDLTMNREGIGIQPSLPEAHRSIQIPVQAGKIRRFLAYAGPAYMVSVGYMDPGNWATDIAGGAQFGYTLLSVILISNIFAMVLQHLSVKLGVVAERDLPLSSVIAEGSCGRVFDAEPLEGASASEIWKFLPFSPGSMELLAVYPLPCPSY